MKKYLNFKKKVMCKLVLILVEFILKNLIFIILFYFVFVFENVEGKMWKILGK